MIATGQMISPGVVMKYLLPFVIVIAVARILAEILKPARRSRRKRREVRRGEAKAKLCFVAIFIFAAFEYGLWMYGGTAGRIVAIAIPVLIFAGTITIVIIKHRRKRRTYPEITSNDALCKMDPQDDSWGIEDSSREELDIRILTDEDIVRREGEKGEMMVRDVVKSLPSDRYVVLHDVWLPMDDGGETQIDHVIVSPYGIFIIETKNWKGTIYADEKSRVWTKYNCGQKMCLKNPTHQNFKHIVSIREKFFSAERDFVFGVVAMSSSAEFKHGVPNGVVYYNELGGWIMGHVTPCIKAEQIPEIVSAIQQWSSTVSEDARRRHCGK